MTDRFHSLTVVLEKDMREDDAQLLISAIAQLRNVLTVSGNVSDVVSEISEKRAIRILGAKLLDTLYPKRNDPKE